MVRFPKTILNDLLEGRGTHMSICCSELTSGYAISAITPGVVIYPRGGVGSRLAFSIGALNGGEVVRQERADAERHVATDE